MYRGVSSPEGKAEEYLDEFRQGDLFVGGGVYGSGTYFASGHPESTLRTAKDYANREGGNEQRGTETGPNERSAIARFGMKKGARILEVDTYDPKDKDKIAQMRQKQIKAAGEGVDPGLLAAIEDDGLTWIHVSDLKGWSSPVIKQFNIDAVPTIFVLDENNRIVAKNLRGEALRAFVSERLK